MVPESTAAEPRQARVNQIAVPTLVKLCLSSGCMVGDGASTWGSLPSLNAREEEEGGEKGRKRFEEEREGVVEGGEGGGGGKEGGGAGLVQGGAPPPPGMPCFTKCKQGITLFHHKSEKRCQLNKNFRYIPFQGT